ncbi:MAG: response regulator [Synechococcaceae cyanobacterium SM2_3_1]|nr:response regulator [Synechococcaceae cyanobacterium SM2_3_1]
MRHASEAAHFSPVPSPAQGGQSEILQSFLICNRADLSTCLQRLSTTRFTGRLDLIHTHQTTWSLHLCLGRLVWISKGIQPTQRWRRVLSQYYPNVDVVELEILTPKHCRLPEYAILTGLLQRHALTREQLVALVEDVVIEGLFDLLQTFDNLKDTQASQTGLTGILIADDKLDAPLTLIRSEQALEKAQQQWEGWYATGLATYSPHCAPLIRRSDVLRQQTTARTFQLLSTYVNGQRSLRTLAIKFQQELVTLAEALFPYVAAGIMALVEPSQSPDPEESPTTGIVTDPVSLPPPPRPQQPQPQVKKPLVVCIDDSAMVAKQLELVLEPTGCQLLSIQDPLQAIPQLLKHKPDLILLDLMMPVVNGYEICAQIRRVSGLKSVPVVILTSNDGVVDRVRAKMVGSTDFLAKPVDPKKLLETMQRLLAI